MLQRWDVFDGACQHGHRRGCRRRRSSHRIPSHRIGQPAGVGVGIGSRRGRSSATGYRRRPRGCSPVVWCSPGPIYLPVVTGYRRRSEGLLTGSALGPCPVLTDLLGAPTAFRALAPGTCFRCQVSGARCQWWLVGLKGSRSLRVVSSLAGSALGPCPVLTDLLGAPTAFRALAPGNWHLAPGTWHLATGT